MAGYDAHLVNLVDERIAKQRVKTSATGTVVATAGAYVYVVMDGDQLALPCKFVGGLSLLPDTRVTLQKYGDDWTVTGDFAKNYWPRKAHDLNAQSNFINTAAALGAPEVGATFVAPPSGEVLVTVGGVAVQSAVGNNTYLSFSVRTGGDWADGATVVGFDYRRGIGAGRAVVSGGSTETDGVNKSPVAGLDPGATYIARTGHWVTPAGTGTVHARYIEIDAVR